ncbi:porin family protein [uncultured Draconibacterium sp.]|uniref:porin family protein n=1 Tax=uncultured Draconibacterium sp. TaxID=1573823 RepID=UPI003216CEFB
MKKIVLVLICVWLIQPGFSQQNKNSYFDQVGVMIAPGFSTVMGGDSWSGTFGFQLGIESRIYKMNENSSVYGGVLFSLQGASYEEIFSDYVSEKYAGKVTLGYISIPILYNYLSDNGFYAEAGIQPGFLISANDKLDGGESYDYKDAINSFDLAIPVGAGFWINEKLSVGARAVFGLTNINSSESYDSDQTDRNFLLLGVVRYNFKKE